MTAIPNLVSLRSVSRTYQLAGVAVTAVRDVNLDVGVGESLAIVGPSGSGKSTMMNMIGLLDRPTEGAVYLDGRDVAALSDNDRSELRARNIGFVFQSYNLLARQSAIENVALPLIYGGVGRKERVARAEQSLAAVGMLHRARHLPRELSGGEQQRVAIARAMVAGPSLLLADEPTGALDSRTGAEILALFDDLNRKGQTIVMITHDAQVAARCRRVVTIYDGEIVADQTRSPRAAVPSRSLAS